MFAKLLLRLTVVAGFAFLLSLSACQQAVPPKTIPAMNVADSKDWDSYVNEFLEAYFVAHPDFAVRALSRKR